MPKKVKMEVIDIVAPSYMNSKVMASTLVAHPNNLIGKKVILPATDYDKDSDKYYLKLQFKIKKLDSNKAITLFDGSECLRDYISRMVVRRVRRVDIVQDIKTKDGSLIRIKSIAVLPGRANKSIEKKVRKRIYEILEEKVKSESLDNFVRFLLNDNLKNFIIKEIKKIYPAKFFEIRKTEILKHSESLE